MKDIILTLITSITSIVIVILQINAEHKNKKRERKADMHSAKQSILQLIMEDTLNKHLGRPPMNYQQVLSEYDTYQKNGGNSYVAEKVEQYKKEMLK